VIILISYSYEDAKAMRLDLIGRRA
jgi:hypothetical protein